MCSSHLCATLFSLILDLQPAYPSSSITFNGCFMYFSSCVVFQSVNWYYTVYTVITETEHMR